jgi:choline monooxygenase
MLSRNLPAAYYVDPAVHQAERQSIFRRAWHLVGPEDHVAAPGQYVAVELAGWKVFALRGKDGQLRAFHNVCRHRGARLLPEGRGQCALLRCPYHHWVYDQEGRLKTAPWFGENPDFRVEDWPLKPVAHATWRGLLFVALDPVESLEAQLGDLEDELADAPVETYRATDTRHFLMKSNWKTYTDNFIEGYHIPGIHPSFIKVIDFARFETAVRRGLVRMTAPQKDGSVYGGKWLWMWPNWTLSLFPGGMNTSRINPLGVDETELCYHFYFTGEATALARQRTVETVDAIIREDFGICEHTQKNYASGAYTPGPLSPRHESSVAYFQRRVLDALGEIPGQERLAAE